MQFHLVVSVFVIFTEVFSYEWNSNQSSIDDELQIDRPLHKQQKRVGHVGKVTEFLLMNADTNLPIVQLIDGMIIDLSTQSTTNFNVEVATNKLPVGSIRFDYNEMNTFRIESERPFALCGDGQPIGNYRTCPNLVVGKHKVSATPFSGVKETGNVGVTKTVSFTIVPEQLELTIECNVPKFIDSDWQSFIPDYPIDTTEPMGLLVGNDMVSFSGFINSFKGVTNQTFARDITIDGSPWRRMDDMPLPVALTHSATAIVDMKIYICGGYIGAHPGPHVPFCYIYDHSKNPGAGQQWTRFVDIPNNGTAGGGMIFDTKRNTLYYSGGGQRLVPGNIHPVDVSNTWKFDLKKQSIGWEATSSIPFKANHLSAVTAYFSGEERHFFVGGQIGEQEQTGNLAEVYEFVASTETFVRRTSMPFGRSHTTLSTRAIGCGFIVAGGSVNSLNGRKNRTSNILFFDISKNIWTTIGDIPVKLATPLVDIHSNGYMYFINDESTSRRQIAF